MSFDKEITVSRTTFDINGDPVQVNANTYVRNVESAIKQLVLEYCKEADMSVEDYIATAEISGEQKPFDEVHKIGQRIIIKSAPVKSGLHSVKLNYVEEPIVLDDTEE